MNYFNTLPTEPLVLHNSWTNFLLLQSHAFIDWYKNTICIFFHPAVLLFYWKCPVTGITSAQITKKSIKYLPATTSGADWKNTLWSHWVNDKSCYSQANMIYLHLFKILNVPTLLLNDEKISLTLIRNTDTLLKRGY